MKSLNLAYQPRFDHIRFLAALLVFLFHLYHLNYGGWKPNPDMPWLGWLVEGYTGIGLFFTLSGYLFMTIALGGGPPRYRAFMRNRFLRIFPLFLVVFLVAISVGRDSFRATDVFYLFFSNIGLAPTSNTFMTGAAWTISVEFTFYFAFPFLARFSLQQGWSYLLRLMFLCLLFKLGAYLVTERSTHMLYSTLVGRFDQFLIGMFLAQAAQKITAVRDRGLGIGWLLGAGMVMGVLLATLSSFASFFRPEPKQLFWLFWPTLEALGWGGVLLAYLGWCGALPAWIDGFIRRGGEISYSFYLLHTLVLYLLHELIGPLALFSWRGGNVILLTIMAGGITWLVANVSYETIEKPFLDLRTSYTSHRQD